MRWIRPKMVRKYAISKTLSYTNPGTPATMLVSIDVSMLGNIYPDEIALVLSPRGVLTTPDSDRPWMAMLLIFLQSEAFRVQGPEKRMVKW